MKLIAKVKGLALILPFMFLVACIGAKAMEVTYNVRSGGVLKDYTVYLVVNDLRSNKTLVGPTATERGLFGELKSGRFDLKVNMPAGRLVTITNLATIDAVKEASSRKLQSQGVTSTSQRAAAHLTVEINIHQMNIDVESGDLLATVALESLIYRDESSVVRSNTKATSNRMRLIGGAGGATVLSDALSQALNDLDFSGINKY